MNDFFTYKNLEKLYLIEKFSLDEIAKKANCSKANIYYHMRKHDIKLRTKSQSRHLAILNNKFNYEKNYMI